MGIPPHRPLSGLVGRAHVRKANATVVRGGHRRIDARQPAADLDGAARTGGMGHRHDFRRARWSRARRRAASPTDRHGGGQAAAAAPSRRCFKTYEKGREKWQGETLDGVWFDEEPPLDIYMEGLTRTNATRAASS